MSLSTQIVNNSGKNIHGGNENSTGCCDTICESEKDCTNSEIMFPDLTHFRAQHKKNFIFAHLNINWFHTKFQEVHEILQTGTVDLLALTETKLNPSIKSDFNVKNFTMYRNDRPNTIAGGGIVCYINSGLPHRPRKDLMYVQDGIESMVNWMLLWEW